MLIYIEGLPYVGKSTLAKGLKSRLGVGWKIVDGQHLTKEELYVLRSGNCGNVVLDSFKPYYELAKEYARSTYVPKSVLKEYQAMLPRPTASFYLHADSDMTLVSRRLSHRHWPRLSLLPRHSQSHSDDYRSRHCDFSNFPYRLHYGTKKRF